MGSPTLKSERARGDLARNIKALTEELQISENELSRRSGVSQKQVNNIVNERTGCGIDAIDALARAAGVSPWVLLCPLYAKVAPWVSRFERVVNAYADLEPASREAAELIVTHGFGSRK